MFAAQPATFHVAAVGMVAGLVGGIVQEAGSWLAGLGAPTAWIVCPGDAAGGVAVGDLEELQFFNSSSSVAVRVLAVDTISTPNRAKVELVNGGKVMIVPVVEQEQVARWVAESPNRHDCEGDDEDGEVGPGTSAVAMMNGRKTTIYQDYEDAFQTDALQALAVPSAAQRDDEASSHGGISPDLLYDLKKDLTEEFRCLGSDLAELAQGAASATRSLQASLGA